MNRSKLLIVAAILLILLCGCDKNDSTENTRSSVNESSAAASSVSEKNVSENTGDSSDSDRSSSSSTDKAIEKNDNESISGDGSSTTNDPESIFKNLDKLSEEQKKQLEELDYTGYLNDGAHYPYAVARVLGYEDESGRKVTYDDVKRLLKEAEEKYPALNPPENMDVNEKWDYASSRLIKQKEYVISALRKIQFFSDYSFTGSSQEEYYYWPETYSPKKPVKSINIVITNNRITSIVYNEYDENNNETFSEMTKPFDDTYEKFVELFGPVS